MGFDLATEVTRIKKRIGVVPETSNLYDELTARDNLVFAMQLYGVLRRERRARAEELLARFRLSEKRDVLFAKLSRGMKRALTIAAALAHRPPLLFLDEPTTGLDVMSARGLRQRLLLVPLRLPALLAGKLLGGMVFGLTVTAVVLVIALAVFGAGGVNWFLLILALLLAAAAFSALGAFASVVVREIFEAQTLANFVRFPMMFLGGIFVPLSSMPPALQVVARALPLTYAVEALRAALDGHASPTTALDLAMLAAFTAVLFGLAVRTLARRVA